jgi:hypothetical protein
VEAGRDVDGDGALSAAEVESTSVVCTAPAPAPARAVLVRTDPLGWEDPACDGSSVVDSGRSTRVSSGLDLNGDGLLQDDEVTASAVVCSQRFYPRYPVATAEDLELVKRSSRVAGSLEIKGSALAELAFYVEAIDGDLVVDGNPNLTSLIISFGSLGGSIIVQDNALLEKAMIRPLYDERPWAAHGSIIVRDNPSLLYLFGTLDHVASVAGDLVLARNGKLLFFPEAPLLGWVRGDVRIEANPALQYGWSTASWSTSFGHFMRVGGGLFLTDNPLLEGALALQVSSVDGAIVLRANPSLEVVRFPSLTRAGSISSSMNGGGLGFSQLQVVLGDVVYVDNQTGYFFTGVEPQVQAVLGSITIARNGPGLASLSMLHGLAYVGGSIRIEDNQRLYWLGMEPLLSAREVVIARNGGLHAIGQDPTLAFLKPLGALSRAGLLDIENNPDLLTLTLPDLVDVAALVIKGNVSLPTCQAEALAAQLVPSTSRSLEISGNDDLATCP